MDEFFSNKSLFSNQPAMANMQIFVSNYPKQL
jgi:hypothetical protein